MDDDAIFTDMNFSMPFEQYDRDGINLVIWGDPQRVYRANDIQVGGNGNSGRSRLGGLRVKQNLAARARYRCGGPGVAGAIWPSNPAVAPRRGGGGYLWVASLSHLTRLRPGAASTP